MADFIKDLLNVVIQHNKNLLQFLELATTLVIVLGTIIILLRIAFATRRSSKYDAKHDTQKTEVSEVLLISALDLVINATRLFLGR